MFTYEQDICQESFLRFTKIFISHFKLWEMSLKKVFINSSTDKFISNILLMCIYVCVFASVCVCICVREKEKEREKGEEGKREEREGRKEGKREEREREGKARERVCILCTKVHSWFLIQNDDNFLTISKIEIWIWETNNDIVNLYHIYSMHKYSSC